MIKVLISATFLFFFLLPSSFSGPPRSSFNFINVYMKSYDIATPNSTLHSYLWGASGQIAFFLDKRTFPVEQILIKIKQANSSALSKVRLPPSTSSHAFFPPPPSPLNLFSSFLFPSYFPSPSLPLFLLHDLTIFFRKTWIAYQISAE